MPYIRLFIDIVVRKVVVAKAVITVPEEDRPLLVREMENQVRKELVIPSRFTVIATVTEARPLEPGDHPDTGLRYTEEGKLLELTENNNWKKQKKLQEMVAHQLKTSDLHHTGKGQNKGTSGGKENHYTNPDKAAKKARKNAQRKGR